MLPTTTVVDVIQRFRTDNFPSQPVIREAVIATAAPLNPQDAVPPPLGLLSFLPISTEAAGACLAAILSLAVLGCGSGTYDGPPRVAVVPVKGKVIFQGKPAANAFVIFHPQSPQGEVPSPRSIADGEGRFAVTTYDHGDGAPEGEYVVTVELKKLVKVDGESKPGPNVLPPKYQSRDTSTLKVRVAKGSTEIPLELK